MRRVSPSFSRNVSLPPSATLSVSSVYTSASVVNLRAVNVTGSPSASVASTGSPSASVRVTVNENASSVALPSTVLLTSSTPNLLLSNLAVTLGDVPPMATSPLWASV